MKNLITEMAQTANKIGIPYYVGDLIHDAMTISKAKPNDIFYWIFKANGCGTHLVSKDSFYMALFLEGGTKAVYEVHVLGIDEASRCPIGTVTECTYQITPREHNTEPKVYFTCVNQSTN